jgi:hypothetical protein
MIYAVSYAESNLKASDDSKINTHSPQPWFGAVKCSM